MGIIYVFCLFLRHLRISNFFIALEEGQLVEEKLRISTKNVIHVGEVFYQSTYHFLLKVVVVMMAGEGYSYGDHYIFKLGSGYSCYFEGLILRVELREENTLDLTGGKTPSYKNNMFS